MTPLDFFDPLGGGKYHGAVIWGGGVRVGHGTLDRLDALGKKSTKNVVLCLS